MAVTFCVAVRGIRCSTMSRSRKTSKTDPSSAGFHVGCRFAEDGRRSSVLVGNVARWRCVRGAALLLVHVVDHVLCAQIQRWSLAARAESAQTERAEKIDDVGIRRRASFLDPR